MTDPAALPATLNALAATLSDGRSGGVRVADGRVTLALEVGGMSAEARDALAEAVKSGLLALDGVSDVRIAMTASKRGRTIVAVGSGKGGVGKSTLAANLAVALAMRGLKVGLVDADIHGPSQPLLMDRADARPVAEGDKLVPVSTAYGVPMLSMGQLAAPGQAIAWRGPMAGRALEQLVDAHWGDVDTLIIDLPPGTGDIQLSMLAKFKPAGALIISTPQDMALIDAARAINLFTGANVPIIGLVENMAGYACPHCGENSDPFGHGGAEEAASELDLDFLGRIPLTHAIRLASDAGVPPATRADGDGAPYHLIAGKLADWLAARQQQGQANAA
jgi:ATP-binding protein involved in chromosome partitioning